MVYCYQHVFTRGNPGSENYEQNHLVLKIQYRISAVEGSSEKVKISDFGAEILGVQKELFYLMGQMNYFFNSESLGN